MGKLVDLTGKTFGRLLVIKQVANTNKNAKWLCKCSCGKYCEVQATSLKRGAISCGCAKSESTTRRSTKHNGRYSRLYVVWCGMIARCRNPKHIHFDRYGGRGIDVCKEWEEFTSFRDWALANGYDEKAPRGKCTIDRIDSDKNYEPLNCRWVDMKAQSNNRHPKRVKNSPSNDNNSAP